MMNQSIWALLISFAVCAVLCRLMIPVLHRMKFGQNVRSDGPESHLKKQGTPTMGGIMIVLGIIAGTLPFLKSAPLTARRTLAALPQTSFSSARSKFFILLTVL